MTDGPQDIAGIFIGFVWVFLSAIVEMLVIALGLCTVEAMLYDAGRSTMAGFVFSCLLVMFMCCWAAFKFREPNAPEHAPPTGR